MSEIPAGYSSFKVNLRPTSLLISFLRFRDSLSFLACMSCKLAYLRNATIYMCKSQKLPQANTFRFSIKFRQIRFCTGNNVEIENGANHV